MKILRPCLLSLVLASLSGRAEEGWRPLFNGTDLAGWVVKGKPDDRPESFWRVKDGAIVADSMDRKGHDYVWLLSEKEYGDFEVALKFQAFRDSPGNSGIQIRSRYDDAATFLDGPQIDIHPPAPWRTGMIWDETRGSSQWLWPVTGKGKWVNETMAVSNRVWKFSDEGDGWNDLRICAKGTKLTAELNGLKIMDWDGQGVLDDQIHQNHRVGMRGHLALQIHRGDRLRIGFKDLRIREFATAP